VFFDNYNNILKKGGRNVAWYQRICRSLALSATKI
jgi:hypothetical protein